MTNCADCNKEIAPGKRTVSQYCDRKCKNRASNRRYRQTHERQPHKNWAEHARRYREAHREEILDKQRKKRAEMQKRPVRTPVEGVHVHSEPTMGSNTRLTVYMEMPKQGATLELSQQEADYMGNRLRYIGYRANGNTPPVEVTERVWVESTPQETRIWIAGTPVELRLTRVETGTLGGQLNYHGGIGKERQHQDTFEEIDDVLLLQIMQDKSRPYDGTIPYGHKDHYIKELLNAGWSINDIMLRVKASGKTIKKVSQS